MSEVNSTTPTPRNKPSKPYPDFPLTAHPAGYWCKKIRGKIHYFGKWEDPEGALDAYLKQKDALLAGRTPRPDTGELTVKSLVNSFLNHKQSLMDAGELSPHTWTNYKGACDLLVTAFGKTRLVADLDPSDFALLRKRMAKRWGPARLSLEIQLVKGVFKYGVDNDLIERPMRYGQGFQRPSAKVLRLHKAKQGPKLFTREEIQRIFDAADVQLKGMVLLGLNCGFGNADVARLTTSALDLDAGWVNYPRPKTGIPRRCPLWPETVAAIKEALAHRREPKDPANAALVFLTLQGFGWGEAKDSLADKTGRLLRLLGINGRTGLGFYTLRHVFRTVADESKDQVAVDYIMGHALGDMASVYRERISDERLQAVVNHVHAWLFPPAREVAKPEQPSDVAEEIQS